MPPETEKAFQGFSRQVVADGALPVKVKQLIAVAVAHVGLPQGSIQSTSGRPSAAEFASGHSPWAPAPKVSAQVTMTNVLFILNDSPYGGVRSYNALRIATVLSRHASYYVRVVLLGAAIACAQADAIDGIPRYDTLALLRAISVHGGEVCACDSCIEGVRIHRESLVAACRCCALEELTGWIGQADRLLVF